jgi:hypothetical protein
VPTSLLLCILFSHRQSRSTARVGFPCGMVPDDSRAGSTHHSKAGAAGICQQHNAPKQLPACAAAAMHATSCLQCCVCRLVVGRRARNHVMCSGVCWCGLVSRHTPFTPCFAFFFCCFWVVWATGSGFLEGGAGGWEGDMRKAVVSVGVCILQHLAVTD